MRGRPPIALAAVLLTGSACSPGPAPSPDANQQTARSEPAARANPKTAPVKSAIAASASGARRCGWLSNPTPANWWLTDSEGQWILATQGADQAPGLEDMPDMSTSGWVETNGHYGYGCACMTITADADGRVTRIAGARPRPLKQCQADRNLPKPE
jgi:hypothetical protein